LFKVCKRTLRWTQPCSAADHASFASPVPEDKIVGALALMLDTRNHPMLIHCNKGKVSVSLPSCSPTRTQLANVQPALVMQHRTGCLIGCLRKVQQWSLTQIFSEYRLYSYPKSRSMDQQFIEAFAGLPDVSVTSSDCSRSRAPSRSHPSL